VNQAWVSFTRYFGGRLNISNPVLGLPAGASLANFGSAITVQGTPSLPNIAVTNFFNLTNAIGGPTAGSNFYSVRDTFTYTHGHHSFKLGGEVTLQKDVQDTLLNNYGTYTFNGTATANSAANPKVPGNALADFLLGIPSAITQDAPIRALTNSWFTSVFAQDDYKIFSRLTLTEAAALFSGHIWDVPQQVKKSLDEIKTAGKAREHLLAELAELEASRLLAETTSQGQRKVVVRSYADRDLTFIRLLAQKITRLDPTAVALLGAGLGQGALVFAQTRSSPFDLGALLKDIVAAHGGKGGGSRDMAQGGLPGAALIETALAQAAAKVNA